MFDFFFCYAGDVWSENGVAIFAIIVHFIDANLRLNNRLVLCKGLHDIAQSFTNLAVITYKGLFEASAGPDINTFHEDIQVYIPDEGSDMPKA